VSAIKSAIARLQAREDLGRDEITEVFRELMAGTCEPAQIGALLMGLACKGETADEIAGAAAAMREAVTRVPTSRAPLLDTCGTGGSGIARRNVSTAVAIVVAACGVAVAKHGNRAASSRSGSADVLEALGVRIDADAGVVGRCIDEVGIGFLFAAALHPAMKHAMGPRRALGVRTIFNLLGPLTNPAGARRQVCGVFDPRRCVDLATAMGALGCERALVVHGFRRGVRAAEDAAPAIDDASPEGETLVAQWHAGEVTRFVITPERAGIEAFAIDEITGGDPHENAEALVALLDGERGPYREAVRLSGSLALLAAGDEDVDALPSLADRIGAALDDGSARRVLDALIRASQQR
jgi:anthranilate phosphoribosyltransferase